MRVFCLVAAVVLVGCAHHPAFVSGGVQYAWPAADEDTDLAEVASSIGGGVSLSENDDRARATYLEGWVQQIPDIEDSGIDVTTAGVGLRLPLIYSGYGKKTRYTDTYVRFGGLYQHFEGGSDDGWGGYVGIGHDFYLDKARTWSLAPEIIVGGLFFDTDEGSESNVYASAGLSLTYHFGGKSKKQK